MPITLFPARSTGRRSKPRVPGTWRRVLRTAMVSGVVLGVVLPGTAARAEPSLAEIEKRIDTAAHSLEKIIEDYNGIKEDLKKSTEAAKKHAAALPALQVRYAEARAEVSAIAATAYKTGQLREVNAMLEGRSENSLINRISTLDHLARGRQSQLDEYTTAKQRYDTVKAQQDAAIAKQNAQSRVLVARKKKIEADLKKLYDLRRKAYGSATESGGSGAIPPGTTNAVAYAKAALGAPYVPNAAGPYNSGYDCSGLTMAAWAAAGQYLPHNAAMQFDKTTRIGRSALQPGDLVFYSGLGHVAIYVGGGKIIHAPEPGEVVKYASIDMMAPYGYGRIKKKQ